MKKILIIKLGYSETLEHCIGKIVNLGDVLRTTFILNFYKQDNITWLVDQQAVPLLEKNPFICKILTYDTGTINALKNSHFDIIINFEKSDEIFAICDTLKFNDFYGFKRNQQINNNLTLMSEGISCRKNNTKCWQEILCEAIGQKWNQEPYVLGYKPKTKPCYDIGFNWTTGKRWTNKAWPLHHWKKLEGLINSDFTVSWQKGFNDMYEYIDWINSCRLIVTADTLGLHLGLALKKRVIGLFGPTAPHEFAFYDCGKYLLPESSCDCIPCFQTGCTQTKNCMEDISPREVKKAIYNEFTENIITSEI